MQNEDKFHQYDLHTEAVASAEPNSASKVEESYPSSHGTQLPLWQGSNT
jgi:hypothetical protein